MKLINCTPHSVIILSGEKKVIIESSGIIPRIDTIESDAGLINTDDFAVPLTKRIFKGCSDLPEQVEGRFLIVSGLIAGAFPERKDLIVPKTIRDDSGRIIGCNGFYIN